MIDEQRECNNGPCHIRFQLGDISHEMNLARFSELLQLPASGEPFFVQHDYSQSEF